MSKQPFLPLFFGDFLASTAEWSGEEASLYLTLLGHQWTLGTLPADPAKLARLVRWERKSFDKAWPQVSVKFEAKDGRLVNARLEQHRAKSDELAEKNRTSGRKGAEARWRKDGERHSPAMASAKEGLCHPSHPIPSHPEVLSPSPQESRSPPALAQARARASDGPAAEACRFLREAGCADVNPTHPNLIAALEEGVTPEQLRDVAAEFPGKRFAYLIATARSRRLDVPAVAAAAGRAAPPVVQTWTPPDDEPPEERPRAQA